jgi:cytochrome P450
VYGIYIGLTPMLVVTDADLLKDIMVRNFSNFTDRRQDGFDHPLEQKFMLVTDGEHWKRVRAAMTAAFSSAKMKGMYEHFYTCSDNALKQVEKNIGKPMEIKTFFKNFTVDVIGKCAFGVEFGVYDNMNPTLENALYFFQPSTIKSIIARLLPKWFKTAINFSVLNPSALRDFASLARAMMDAKIQAMKENGNSNDYITLLLENSGFLTEDDIIANIILLFWVAFETATYHMSYTTFLLARYPDIQERLHNEIMEACERDISRINCDLVSNLRYLEAVSNESLRYYPPSTFTGRRVSKDCTLEGIHLPKDTLIFIPIYAMHHSEEYWNNPKEFNPDRFLPENKDSIHPFAFQAFGYGPRNCIGARFETLQSKVMLAKLVLKYRVSRLPETPLELDLSSTNDELLMTPDIYLRFEKR